MVDTGLIVRAIQVLSHITDDREVFDHLVDRMVPCDDAYLASKAAAVFVEMGELASGDVVRSNGERRFETSGEIG